MIDRSIHSQYIEVEKHRRIIAISDIHANLRVLKKLLKKIDYQPDKDELFLVGDLLEKGNQNIETLQYLMELAKNSHVHPMIGNCDFVCKNILWEYRLDYLKEILLHRKESILHEMCSKIGKKIQIDSNMVDIAQALKKAFPDELAFIDTLPHVIETQDYIFAHAGILDEITYGHDMRDIMTHDQFYKYADNFQKYVVVGHLPVSEYSKGICSFNPLIDHMKHIICIDGGNMVKHAGQLNALIIKDKNITYAHSDALPKVTIVEDIESKTSLPFFITWHERSIEILHKQTKSSFCRHLASGKELWIPNSFIHIDGKDIHAENFTTHQMSVKKGEKVKLVFSNQHYSLIKKHGIMGWIPNHAMKS